MRFHAKRFHAKRFHAKRERYVIPFGIVMDGPLLSCSKLLQPSMNRCHVIQAKKAREEKCRLFPQKKKKRRIALKLHCNSRNASMKETFVVFFFRG